MIPLRNRAQCSDCAVDLDVTAPGIGEWVTGFVVSRDGGGPHALSCRTGTGRYLCRTCVHARQQGLSPDQASLFSVQ